MRRPGNEPSLRGRVHGRDHILPGSSSFPLFPPVLDSVVLNVSILAGGSVMLAVQLLGRHHFAVRSTVAITFSQASSSFPLFPPVLDSVILNVSIGAGGLVICIGVRPKSCALS